jgi:hypothetical protein
VAVVAAIPPIASRVRCSGGDFRYLVNYSISYNNGNAWACQYDRQKGEKMNMKQQNPSSLRGFLLLFSLYESFDYLQLSLAREAR